MTIDPRFGFWFSIVMTVVSTLGVCGAYFTTLFGDSTSAKILAGLAILNAINSAINAILHAIPAKANSANEFALGPKVAQVILLGLVLGALAFPGGAQAQIKKPQITGDVVADTKANLGVGNQNTAPGAAPPTIKPQELMQKIVALAAPDLVYAVALATKANTNAATVRVGCLKAVQALNAQVSGTGLVDASGNPLTMPAEPHIFTDLEMAAEGIDALSPTGPLFTSCAGAAALAGMNVLAFINAMVAGTAAAAIVVPK